MVGHGWRPLHPHQEGMVLNNDDDEAYVDGGIAAPFPPTPLDTAETCTGRIVVSPIAGEYVDKQHPDRQLLVTVCPRHERSWISVPLAAPTVSVRAPLSLQNLRAWTTAMGVVPNGGILRDWYERGREDAHEMLNGME